MLVRTSDHLNHLMLTEYAIRRQFEQSSEEADSAYEEDCDPLLERMHEVLPGLIHKYSNRVLALMTTECAAYCRFCTRRRMVSETDTGKISAGHIDKWVNYLRQNPHVKEVILSGGDPFIISDELFAYALDQLSSIPTIKTIRIGTRAPVADPILVNRFKLAELEKIEQPVYIGIHFEHPAELTERTIGSIKSLRKSGAILYSQSVFLKGVNDDYDTLYKLFSGLLEVGVRPYYIYRCDNIPGAAHFVSDFDKERQIMTKLRSNLSGLACPTYIIDVPHGSGKVPVPLCFWDTDTSHYTDFNQQQHTTE